ncbi:MAG TPA: translation initiation factor IF-2 N-terminal domain-containing protein, partial [Candidatus Baltobacteraceae bacterium]|nr:translation initiation factor IF-2 N-terminal domain-containing protein [Candidatus Baltobacteraceae bacterium]
MATGKVRIFELAKEVGLTSKELITLFNERLGGIFEAKNQLSVVPDHIADLVRSVLLKPAAPNKAKPEAAPAPPPAKPAATKAPKPEPPAAPAEPIPTLKPVAATSRRTVVSKPAAPAKAEPAAPAAAAPTPETKSAAVPKPAPAKSAAAKPVATPPAERPAAAARPAAVARPATPAAPPAPIPRLRPVPTGQPIPQRRQAPPPTTSASASPGPQTGLPGRPGVAPRPGQAGGQTPMRQDGQSGTQPRVPQPGRLISPAPQRRPQGNGPFRPLTPPGNRPFTPRPGGLPPSATDAPAPSSGAGGGRPGAHGRDRDDKINKKDREKELLLEKERTRKKRPEAVAAPPPAKLETIEIPDLLTVQELATSMIIPAKDIIGELIKMGTMATINQNIPSDVAISVAKKFGFNAVVKEAGEEVTVEQEEDKPEMLTPRPPVVTVLGHVDHGKTSLLDKIRSANVAGGEAGGITQRIGAYTVEQNDRKITFIDTPGHEAFTAMRARGANVTDIVVLVVAADDGIMPQTVEAISHARNANVPMIVAINKVDLPQANPARVKQELLQHGVVLEEFGGQTLSTEVSAKKGTHVQDLLDQILLQAEILDKKANPEARAKGTVIEAQLDPGKGPVATVLVENGTLHVGDDFICG